MNGDSCVDHVFVFFWVNVCISSVVKIFHTYALEYCIWPNRSSLHELKGLGARLKHFNIPRHLVPTTVVYTCTHTVTGTTWTFVYMEEAICACAVAKRSRIFLEFYCFVTIFWYFIRHLGWICPLKDVVCFVAGGACESICTALLLGHVCFSLFETSVQCFDWCSVLICFNFFSLPSDAVRHRGEADHRTQQLQEWSQPLCYLGYHWHM